MSEHQVINPNVIIMAAVNVMMEDVTPKKASKNSPRKEASNCFNANREILEEK